MPLLALDVQVRVRVRVRVRAGARARVGVGVRVRARVPTWMMMASLSSKCRGCSRSAMLPGEGSG